MSDQPDTDGYQTPESFRAALAATTDPAAAVVTAAAIVRPGDVLVVGTRDEWTDHQITLGREMWESLQTGVKLMILPGVTTMAVVQPRETT